MSDKHLEVPQARRESVSAQKCELHVIAHAAKHLLAKDFSGSSDPFLRVSIDGKVVATTRTQRADLNPVWNEEFIIPLEELPDPDSLTPLLKIEILNEYKFGKVANSLHQVGKAGFLGQIVVPLGKLLDASFLESKRWYELQKRSSKSHVRGSVQLTMYIDTKNQFPRFQSTDSFDAWSPRSMSRRSSVASVNVLDVSSDYSVGGLQEYSKTVSEAQAAGTYDLHVQFIKSMEMPLIDCPQNVTIMFQAECGKVRQRVDRVDSVLIQDDGTLSLNNETVKLTILVRPERQANVKLSVAMPKMGAITKMLSDFALGRASVPLTSIPVLEDSAGVESLPAVDVYLEKPSLTPVPLYLHVRDSHSQSICRLRVKIWMVKATQVPIEEEDEEGEEQELTMTGELPEPYHWELISADFSVPIDKLHETIFNDEEFMQKFSAAKKYSESNVTPWKDGAREFSYMIPSSRFVKANKATEYQKYVLKQPGNAYVVDVETKTPDVPYGSDFVTLVQYRLTKVDKESTRLLISAEVKFYKSPMIKGMITKAAKSGMQDTFNLFSSTLRSHLGSSGPASSAKAEQPKEQAEPSGSPAGSGLTLHFDDRTLAIIAIVEFMIILVLGAMWLSASTSASVLRDMHQK